MFDALPETRGNGKIVASRSLSTAVFAHGLVIGLIVGTALLARVDAGEDPPVPRDITIVVMPKGVLEAGGGGPVEKPRTPKPPEKDPEVVAEPLQPVAVQTLPEPEAAPPVPEVPPVTSEMPAEGDDYGQGGNGRGGGKGTGDGPGEGSGNKPGKQGVPDGVEDLDTPFEEPLVVTGPVDPPVLILKIAPDYPEIARQARKEGKVILEAIIGTDGHVESVRVLRSDPLFDRAATKAVSQWLYRPAKLHGLAVKVYFTVVIDFRLN